MYLDNNDLTDWTTVLPAVNQMNWPAQGFASNSQCTLTGQGSAVSYDGTTFANSRTLTMTLNLQFTSSFPGINFIDEYVWDTQFGIADWGQLGTVTVGAPPIITTLPGDLGFGIASQPYSVTLNANGRLPLTWSVTSGTLPPGISLSAAGVLSGQQPQAATTSFTIGVKDAVNISAVTPLSASLQILNPSDVGTPTGPTTLDPYMPATQVGLFRNNSSWRTATGMGSGLRPMIPQTTHTHLPRPME